ncbi:MAG: DUF308 domain-containing protein [Clostridiales bacterium]|nr:DUF308 domain-containing protein [Clostridiales bacterium]
MRRRSSFGWMELAIGILLIALGILAVCWPQGVLTGIVMIYGVIAVLTGIVDIVFYVRFDRFTGFGPIVSLISGVLSVMVGFMLLVYPDVGTRALSILFPLWFLAHCFSRLAHLPFIRREAGPGYYYFMLVANIIGIMLAVLMLFQPVFSYFSLGLIIGVYLILLGIDSIVLGVSGVGAG